MEQQVKFLMTDTGDSLVALCKQVLAQKNIEVVLCEKNGTAVLDALVKHKPAAALLDAFMPGLDAVSVKRRYEANASNPSVRFFVMGTSSNEVLEKEILDSGIGYYFLKPFDVDTMAEIVSHSVGAGQALPLQDDE